jgi:hypothetical protein
MLTTLKHKMVRVMRKVGGQLQLLVKLTVQVK